MAFDTLPPVLLAVSLFFAGAFIYFATLARGKKHSRDSKWLWGSLAMFVIMFIGWAVSRKW
ncbi:MAG: hypothetical protein V1708_00530 [Candidatus Micrarchaeota archaeon]